MNWIQARPPETILQPHFLFPMWKMARFTLWLWLFSHPGSMTLGLLTQSYNHNIFCLLCRTLSRVASTHAAHNSRLCQTCSHLGKVHLVSERGAGWVERAGGTMEHKVHCRNQCFVYSTSESVAWLETLFYVYNHSFLRKRREIRHQKAQ